MTTLTPVQRTEVEAVTRTAREYLRVSKGKGRTARSIRDQHTDNLEAEEEFGPWLWGEAYQDTGSASKFARKQRGDFEKLVSDLREGDFGRPDDVLVLWEISRLARETGRGVEIVDLCEAQGYRIHITSHERTYNPRNYNDRHELISLIADAEREARRLSKRTLRGLNSAAKEGRPQGNVPFGYERDYEVVDRRPRPVAQYPHGDEGKLVAELFVRIAGVEDNQYGLADGERVPLLFTNTPGEDGGFRREPMYSLSKEWEGRGIVSRDKKIDGELVPGIPFSPQNMRSMVRRPAYAGLRKHNGTIIPMQWEGYTPIITKALFDLVQKILDDPSRRTYTGDHIKHVLSMTMRCGVCGLPMAVMPRFRKDGTKAAPGYQGHPCGHVWVNKEDTDRIIIGDVDRFDPETGKRLPPELGVILKYLADPVRHAALRRRPDSGGQERTVRTELERLNTELEELEKAPTPKTARARIQRTKDMEELEADIAVQEAKLTKLTTPAPLAALLPDEPITDVVAWWKGTSLEKQRAIAAVLLTPELLGEVRVMPAPGRKPTPVAERLAWHLDVED
ncbi:recombinase family protein [Streptomyces sp. NPDC045251]|uniref:recombinase family protein n=1 Tax=unclassified Streptomyces TaxID=2593676 RepID=UPI0033E33664